MAPNDDEAIFFLKSTYDIDNIMHRQQLQSIVEERQHLVFCLLTHLPSRVCHPETSFPRES
jgi:hypothetical protein